MKKDFLQNIGYKREGNIYVPPILQLGKFNPVHWINEILPELLWIGLLQNRFGFESGSNMASGFLRAALSVSENKNIWFGPISNFTLLTDLEKGKLKSNLSENHLLKPLQLGLTSFTHFYPNFPINFLLPTTVLLNENAELEKLKAILTTIFDRTSISANLIQGVAFNMIFMTTIDFQINSESPLAQFPKFIEYPSSEISKEVASSIRSGINQLFLNFKESENIDKSWAAYFWNMGLQIDNCY